MKISDMIASAKYYFYAKANQPKENRNLYYREVTEEDKVSFQEVTYREDLSEEKMYYSSLTRRATDIHPRDVPTIIHGLTSTDEKIATYMREIGKGCLWGLVACGTSSLLGYYIITANKAYLIGGVLGAIKAYIKLVPWQETPMEVNTFRDTLRNLYGENGERVHYDWLDRMQEDLEAQRRMRRGERGGHDIEKLPPEGIPPPA